MYNFSTDISFPDHQWAFKNPSDTGFHLEKLEAALHFAKEHRSSGVVISHQGCIVAESYWNDWNNNSNGPIYSATKSVLSALYGIALHEGHLDSIDTPITDFITEWQGSDKKAIHISHLLGMCSGLRCSFTQDFVESAKSDNEFEYALTLDLHQEIGSTWAYNNTAYRLLLTLLERATGRSIDNYFRQYLAEPLGMKNAYWAKRVTPVKDNPNFVHCSARDLTRFGLLIQSGGQWDDEQLIDPEYLKRSLEPHQPTNSCYGLLWWLNNGSHWQTPYKFHQHEGNLLPDCPRDTIAALGFKDNKVYIIPSLDLVVTRLGETAVKIKIGEKVPNLTMSGFDNPFLSQICEALLT